MLRVRPIHYTSRTEQWKQLLTALGMVQTEDDGGREVFDSASGRLVLHPEQAGSGQDGRTVLAVEVGDVAEFARRTNLSAQEDGTEPAGPVTGGQPDACLISAPDGFSFMAGKADHFAQCADADPSLAVVGVWYTADPEGAARTLLHVGARPRPVPDNDETADFTAKNGGVLLVRPASGPSRSGLGFEYGGTLEPLRERLAAAGFTATVTEEAFGSTLHVANPDAPGPNAPATVWISQRRPMG
ncbi:VOC family protein [Arthrobacter sp. C152]